MIGPNAFYGCQSLKEFSLPDGITEIGSGAFCGCMGIESFKIPDGVTKIKDNTFENCRNLKKIHIPDGVTEIEGDAFCKCWDLIEVYLPDSLIKTGNNVFLETPVEYANVSCSYAESALTNLYGGEIPADISKILQGSDQFQIEIDKDGYITECLHITQDNVDYKIDLSDSSDGTLWKWDRDTYEWEEVEETKDIEREKEEAISL